MAKAKNHRRHPIVQQLIDLHARSGMAVDEAAALSGLGRWTLYQWMRDVTTPLVVNADRWAEAYGKRLALVDIDERQEVVMPMKPEESACPRCEAPPGTLSINIRAVASSNLKTGARFRPVLECLNCGMTVPGEFDKDGRHAVFNPPAAD